MILIRSKRCVNIPPPWPAAARCWWIHTTFCWIVLLFFALSCQIIQGMLNRVLNVFFILTPLNTYIHISLICSWKPEAEDLMAVWQCSNIWKIFLRQLQCSMNFLHLEYIVHKQSIFGIEVKFLIKFYLNNACLNRSAKTAHRQNYATTNLPDSKSRVERRTTTTTRSGLRAAGAGLRERGEARREGEECQTPKSTDIEFINSICDD